MRDPERIKRILNKLEEAWTTYPDMRFCQLLENWLVKCHRDGCDYYTEDDVFEERLDKLLVELKKPRETTAEALESAQKIYDFLVKNIKT